MTAATVDPLQIRELILNTRKPIILRNFQTNWNCFQSSLAEWCEKYDAGVAGAPSDFERMQRQQSSSEPQWERRREPVQMTTTEFLQKHNVISEQEVTGLEYWTALNYKRAYELPDVCRAGVSFDCFGFAQATDDCSFWLGSAGANTPCHYDTYGCNIVVQVYGRKSWLLLPPDAPLTSTRIPYEESSVYCTENFYAPNGQQLADLQKLQNHAYCCILAPNDVLIVPRHWWHYVEALETSLSVNYWIPLTLDIDAQLEECIVKYLMETFVKHEDEENTKYLLNPNQLIQIADDAQIFPVLKHLLETVETRYSGVSSKQAQPAFDYQYVQQTECKILQSNLINVCEIPAMTNSEFSSFLSDNAKRFDTNCKTSPVCAAMDELKEVLINSICCPRVVAHIKNEFYARYNNEKRKKQLND